MFKKILDLFVFPKQSSWVILVVWGILLFLPEPLKIHAPGPRGFIVSCVFNLMVDLSVSWIFCLVGVILCRIHRAIYFLWSILWTIIIVLYSFSELFLISFFNLQWNAFTLQLLNETNRKESLGFFETYGGSWQFVVFSLSGIIVLAVCIWAIVYFREKKVGITAISTVFRYVLVSIFFLLIRVESRCFTANANVNYYRSDKLLKRSGLWNLYQSILIYSDGKEQLEICAKSQRNLQIIRHDNVSDNIILIIGETFNRHHSDLYGYPLPTNPCLRKKNPIVFTDVVTPYNATTLAFRELLSFEEVGGPYKWYETPLFPAFFKAAGYNVVFYSNQYVVEGGLDYYDSSAGFFNHPSIYKLLFNERNHQKHIFDMQIVDDYKQNRANIEAASKNLIIFHLEGQHSPAVERFPREFAKFSASDYTRPELTMDQRQYIADYDNATLYNDRVVSEIISMFEDKNAIIIYFADHGEEIYDFRDKAGRFSDFEQSGADGIRNQLDVPFLVFMTDQYRTSHPDILASIESAKNRPFMTDYLPHLMLWLGGIDSKWYDDSKNLFSDSYDCSRSRMVANESLDYNIICK